MKRNHDVFHIKFFKMVKISKLSSEQFFHLKDYICWFEKVKKSYLQKYSIGDCFLMIGDTENECGAQVLVTQVALILNIHS